MGRSKQTAADSTNALFTGPIWNIETAEGKVIEFRGHISFRASSSLQPDKSIVAGMPNISILSLSLFSAS